MVTATATKVRVLQAGVIGTNIPSYAAQAIDRAALELASQALLQAEAEVLHRTLAKRRRVDTALDQIASYW